MERGRSKNRLWAFAAVVGIGAVGVVGAGQYKADQNPECAGLEFVDYAKCGLGWLDETGSTLPNPQIAAPAPETTTAPAPAPAPAPTAPAVNPNECPFNGLPYDPSVAAQWVRPQFDMLENSKPARDQYGLNDADEVFEYEVEGRITRFGAIFYCQPGDIRVGPMRSARQVSVSYAQAMGTYPLFAHVGGAYSDSDPTVDRLNALGMVNYLGWNGYNDIDAVEPQFAYHPEWMPPGRSREHTDFTSTAGVLAVAASRGLTDVDVRSGKRWDEGFRRWNYKDDAPVEQRGNQSITIPFAGDPDYTVDWIYNPIDNTYMRMNGGKPHLDSNTGQQVFAKNVIILSVNQTRHVDEKDHVLQDTLGTGSALICTDGICQPGTWERPNEQTMPIIRYTSGQEALLNRGRNWITIVGNDSPAVTH